MKVRLGTRKRSAGLLAGIAESLARDLVPERTQKRVDPLLGAGLVEGCDRPLPESLVEELQRASLCESGRSE